MSTITSYRPIFRLTKLAFLRAKATFHSTEATVVMKWQLIDLFHKGGLLTYSLICMIISLSGLVSMCKVQKNSDFQTRPERLIIIRIKE